jgi:hypothetical protein
MDLIFLRNITLLNFFLTELLLCELGYSSRVMSGSSTLRGELGASSSLVFCVWPLCGLGAQGGEEYP